MSKIRPGPEEHAMLQYLLDLIIVLAMTFSLSDARFQALRVIGRNSGSIYYLELLSEGFYAVVVFMLAVALFSLFYVVGRFLTDTQRLILLVPLTAVAGYVGGLLGYIAANGLQYLPFPFPQITSIENITLIIIVSVPFACIAAVSSIGGYMTGLARKYHSEMKLKQP